MSYYLTIKPINNRTFRPRKSFLFITVCIFVYVCSATIMFAARSVPGVVPSTPQMFPIEPGVRPNLSGSVQHEGTAVLPVEGENGVAPAEAGQSESGRDSEGVSLVPTRESQGSWWLWILVAVAGALGYAYYRRWKK